MAFYSYVELLSRVEDLNAAPLVRIGTLAPWKRAALASASPDLIEVTALSPSSFSQSEDWASNSMPNRNDCEVSGASRHLSIVGISSCAYDGGCRATGSGERTITIVAMLIHLNTTSDSVKSASVGSAQRLGVRRGLSPRSPQGRFYCLSRNLPSLICAKIGRRAPPWAEAGQGLIQLG